MTAVTQEQKGPIRYARQADNLGLARLLKAKEEIVLAMVWLDRLRRDHVVTMKGLKDAQTQEIAHVALLRQNGGKDRQRMAAADGRSGTSSKMSGRHSKV